MSLSSYSKKIYTMATNLAKQRGGSAALYYADAAYCSRIHGASPENYFVLRFFELSNRQRKTFLTSGRSKKADAYLNRRASGRDRAVLARKELFDKAFSAINHRDFLYAPEAAEAELKAFLERHETVFLKPSRGTQGQGASKISSQMIADIPAFYQSCKEKALLLETVIPQHPTLEVISPGCVNSLRVNAARNAEGKLVLIGAALRCGGAGAFTDNFHSGGIAYPVSLENGQVCGGGRDNTTLKNYLEHPASGCPMIALELPFFEQAMECVYRGMELVPSMGYVGWDIAITPEGVELIEGNFGYPGGNIIQLDGVGKYPKILSCMGETYEK